MAADLDSHPKILKAGADGREVFLFLLRRNAQMDYEGRLPLSELEPTFISHHLMRDESTVSHGLSRCVTAGLLERDIDFWGISGWDEEWSKRAMTAAERKAKSRAKSLQPKEEGAEVTKSHDSIVTQSDCHTLDQIRSDQIIERGTAGSARLPRAASLREDWEPNEQHRALATGLHVSVAAEAALFRDHYAAVGGRMRDWDAAFRKWLRNASKFEKSSTVRGAPKAERPKVIPILGSRGSS